MLMQVTVLTLLPVCDPQHYLVQHWLCCDEACFASEDMLGYVLLPCVNLVDRHPLKIVI